MPEPFRYDDRRIVWPSWAKVIGYCVAGYLLLAAFGWLAWKGYVL